MRSAQGTVLPTRRPGLWPVARKLYLTDTAFRSCLDFAILGLIVVAFVAPSTFSGIGDALSPSAWMGAPAATAPAAAPLASTSMQDQAPQLAQAASSASSAKIKPLKEPLDRRWFALSPEALRPDLETSADLIDVGHMELARETLDRLGQPKDSNILYMKAITLVTEGGKQNLQSALALYKESAAAGNPGAMYEVGQFLRIGAAGPADPAAALQWYKKSDAAGSPDAPFQIARYYVHGWGNVTINPKRAFEYNRKSAELGSAWGANNLGAAYYNGQGVQRDYAKARNWYEKAAAKNLPEALFCLGHMYREGKAGPIDTPKFLELTEQAAAHGHEIALHDLGMFFLNPTDERPADPVRAATYLRKSALRNHGPSQFAFATLYEKGIGVKENLVQAYVYFSLAQRNGQTDAGSRLSGLEQRMTVADMERAKLLATAAGSRI